MKVLLIKIKMTKRKFAQITGAAVGYYVGDGHGAHAGYRLGGLAYDLAHKNKKMPPFKLEHKKRHGRTVDAIGVHNDLSRSIIKVSLSGKEHSKGTSQVHYVLHRNGFLTNSENQKAIAYLTSVFSRQHFISTDGPANATRPPLDQWVVNPFMLNPNYALSGSDFFAAQPITTLQYDDKIAIHGSEWDIQLTNFSAISARCILKVWRAKQNSSSGPLQVGQLALQNESLGELTATFAPAGVQTATGISANFQTGGFVAQYASSASLNVGLASGQPNQISEPYGLSILGNSAVHKAFECVGSKIFTLQGGDCENVKVKFEGSKIMLRQSVAVQNDEYIKGTYIATLEMETGGVKRFIPTTGTALSTDTPIIARGIAEVGWHIVESYNVTPMTIADRVKRQTISYAEFTNAPTFVGGQRVVPPSANAENIVNDIDNPTAQSFV